MEGLSQEASDAAGLPENREFFTQATYGTPLCTSYTTKRKREVTPPAEPSPLRSLALKFSHPPQDPYGGWSLGSERGRNDLLLAKEPMSNGVGRVHFRLHFSWDAQALLLSDSSSNGTTVDSRIWGQDLQIRKTTISLNNGDHIRAGLIHLRVHFPHASLEYQAKWMALRNHFQNAVPQIGGHPLKPSLQPMFDTNRLSLVTDGSMSTRGAHGWVCKAVDCQGNVFAVKRAVNGGNTQLRNEIQTVVEFVHVSNSLNSAH